MRSPIAWCHHLQAFLVWLEAHKENGALFYALEGKPCPWIEGKDEDDWTVLHYALKYKASQAVVMAVLTAWPNAAKVHDRWGNYPLHIALAFHSKVSPYIDKALCQVALDSSLLCRSTTLSYIARGVVVLGSRFLLTRALCFC